MIAVVVFGCANHREARRKSVQLYPGLPQREVVSLFGMPNKAEGNPDEGTRLVTIWFGNTIHRFKNYFQTHAGRMGRKDLVN